MLKPAHIVAAARFTLLTGALAVVVLTLGPFQGAEGRFGLTDKEAHAIAFGGLLAVSFLAFPTMRRNDLTIAALVLGAAIEVAQAIAHRDGNVTDWLADAAGILIVYGVSMIETVRKMAAVLGGTPGGTIGEPFNIPLTAHFIGGCTIGDSPETGVVDPYQRVYNYPGLHIADGSAISANLGVNPSLTITAQAERAMSFWPNKGEADPRPELGSSYTRISPVEPQAPVVPPTAPAALRLPIVEVR